MSRTKVKYHRPQNRKYCPGCGARLDDCEKAKCEWRLDVEANAPDYVDRALKAYPTLG